MRKTGRVTGGTVTSLEPIAFVFLSKSLFTSQNTTHPESLDLGKYSVEIMSCIARVTPVQEFVQ